jgi:hypothetical protein
MPAGFGSTREIRIALQGHPVRGYFQAEVPRDIPEAVPERGQVPAAGPARVAGFPEAFLELASEAGEQDRAPGEGRIFGGLRRVAAKVTARKVGVGRAQQPGCAAAVPLERARWLSRPD